MTITAYHYGWVEFRLCPEGGRGADGHGVTQECFNQHVLRFDVADAAARYIGSMDSKGAQDPSDYVGTKPSSRCDGPGAELKLEVCDQGRALLLVLPEVDELAARLVELPLRLHEQALAL